jgi:hypothetical protein
VPTGTLWGFEAGFGFGGDTRAWVHGSGAGQARPRMVVERGEKAAEHWGLLARQWDIA